MRRIMPRGRARRLGWKAGQARALVVLSNRQGSIRWAEQRWTVGSVVEVYDDLSWEPYEVSERDYSQFLRGFAEGLGLGRVWLRPVASRGNGHNDFRIEAGEPPRPHGGTRRQRRTAATRRHQANRRRWRSLRARLVRRARALV